MEMKWKRICANLSNKKIKPLIYSIRLINLHINQPATLLPIIITTRFWAKEHQRLIPKELKSDAELTKYRAEMQWFNILKRRRPAIKQPMWDVQGQRREECRGHCDQRRKKQAKTHRNRRVWYKSAQCWGSIEKPLSVQPSTCEKKIGFHNSVDHFHGRMWMKTEVLVICQNR